MALPSRSLTEIRSDVCNTTLVVLIVFAVPALAASLSRFFSQGWLPVMGAHIGFMVLLLATFAFRKQLSLTFRAGIVVAIMFLIGSVGVASFGLATEVTVFFVGAGILAACFFGTRVGAAVVGLSCAVLAGAYFAFESGLMQLPDVTLYALSPATWLTAVANVVMACFGPMVAMVRFGADLEHQRLRAEKANAAKSEFLAMMSHELRTPLTGVLGMAELLKNSELSAEQGGNMRRLMQSASDLSNLLDDLFDFTRIEASEIRIEKKPFSLREVMRATSEILQSAAAKKHLKVEARIEVDGEDALIGDPTRLRQMLIILVGNAIKFTEAGEVIVTLGAKPYDDDTVILNIEVADTGIGMSKDQVDKIFEPFAQAEEGSTRRFGGTGLGLAITRRLADAMGGEISVASELGKGSTFHVKLPMRKARLDAVMAQTRTKPGALLSKRPSHILVAEDIETSRFLLVTMLTRMGHTVEGVENGALAVEAVKAGDFDLVLMDMQMPVMDGSEATRVIRTLGSGRADLPVIALTADVVPENHIGFKAAGVTTIMTKPIDWPALSAEIDRCLGESADDDERGASPVNLDLPERPALNASTLDELGAMVGADVLSPMLDTFRDNMLKYRDELSAALAAGDETKIKRTAHALKGLGAQFGAEGPSALAKFIEDNALDTEKVRGAMPSLIKSVGEAERALTAYQQRQSVSA